MRRECDDAGHAPRVRNAVSEQAGLVVQVGTVHGGVRMASQRSDDVPVPYELPGSVNSLVGRESELNELDALLVESEQAVAHSAAIVAVVSGTAGVGKTALITYWAQQRSDRFSNGQLYVNLRGYGPDDPLGADQGLAELLRSFGVRHLAHGIDARAKQFRSLAAGRRMLVVLDNASSDEQVRTLLPGGSSGLVLVTSRHDLRGLVSRDGARRISLGLLTDAQSVDLLRALIGVRVEEEPAAASALAELCARLPLALRIVAELAVSNHDVPLAELVEELADERHRLDLLDAGSDLRTAIRAVFSWSYHALDADEKRVFRLLGLHTGRTYSVKGVAALADLDLFLAARMLRSLVRAHLLERAENRRFRMHDLLRVYALELALASGELA
jgi:hypothetical protein